MQHGNINLAYVPVGKSLIQVLDIDGDVTRRQLGEIRRVPGRGWQAVLYRFGRTLVYSPESVATVAGCKTWVEANL